VASDTLIEAAQELLSGRHFAGVVAVTTGALEDHPASIELRLLRARALLALRRDGQAQTDLRECIQRQLRCAPAYRLLGELCFRRNQFESAAIFLREALRLDPGDLDCRDLLSIVNRFIHPTAAVEKLPAATAAVGPSSFPEPRRARNRPPRLARGTCAPDPGAMHERDPD
jgi:tetratricopeptide (TPR) repeat protein